MLKEGAVLVPNFQQRVMLGVATFVGMLLLVGWIAINEPGRMEAFTLQYRGRSIEAGAAIFLNNCSLCHGVDGKGIDNRAPALNNPMLFLKENPAKAANKKYTDLTTQQTDLQNQIAKYNENVTKLAAANEKLKTVQAGSEEEKTLKTAIEKLNADIKTVDLPRAEKQVQDLQPQIDAAKAELDKVTALGWEPTRDTRLVEVKWAGRLEDYIASTVISGRPVSSLYWPNPMPAWGQQAGGPLRPDEVRDVTAYIMNFSDMAVKMTPSEVNQQFKVPGTTASVKLKESGKAIGTSPDIKALAADIAGGDAALGEQKYSALGCAGCHKPPATTGPKTDGTYTRVLNERLKAPENAGKTAEEYLVESIIMPGNYISPGFTNAMIANFGDQIDEKDLKDLIAFLETQK